MFLITVILWLLCATQHRSGKVENIIAMSLNSKGNLHHCANQEPVFVSKTATISLGEPTETRTSWELSRHGKLASVTLWQVSS